MSGARNLRDTVTVASDLAVIGIAVCVLSIGVLTGAAAVHAGSVAARAVMADPTQHGARVHLEELLQVYRLSLVPGCAVSAVALLLLLDLGAVGRGWVPGGLPMTLAVGVAAATLAAVGALAVVALGHDPRRTRSGRRRGRRGGVRSRRRRRSGCWPSPPRSPCSSRSPHRWRSGSPCSPCTWSRTGSTW